jgi:hypothetical protein
VQSSKLLLRVFNHGAKFPCLNSGCDWPATPKHDAILSLCSLICKDRDTSERLSRVWKMTSLPFSVAMLFVATSSAHSASLWVSSISYYVKSYQLLLTLLTGYLGNWLHYYRVRVVRSKLVFYNILTTSINNTHIKWKNSKTFAVPKQFPRESSEARPILQTLGCHWCSLVGLTSLWHSNRVHSAGSTFTFLKPANFMARTPHALPRQRNGAPLLNLSAR